MKFNSPTRIILGLSIVNLFILLLSCQSPSVGQKIKLAPGSLDDILKIGVTTQSEVLRWLGQPIKKNVFKNQEIWIYEWIIQEPHTIYSGTQIGEERNFMKSLPGYTHVVTTKMIARLIFAHNERLLNYQYYKQ